MGFEPITFRLQGDCAANCATPANKMMLKAYSSKTLNTESFAVRRRTRTSNPLLVRQLLSQLCYADKRSILLRTCRMPGRLF